MKVEREDFESGWSDVSIGLSKGEIDEFIDLLERLQKDEIGHFHFRSEFNDDSRISDIEFSKKGIEEKDNMRF